LHAAIHFPFAFRNTGEMDMSNTNDNGNKGWLILAVVALAAVAYFLLRPHPPTISELAGEWSCTNKPWTITFDENGRITMATIGPTKEGEYELDSEGHLTVTMRDGSRFRANLSMRNSELTVTDPDGTSSSFERNRSRY
jgi:hypothetical protein